MDCSLLKYLTAAIFALLIITSFSIPLSAHVFTTNESASFISLVDQIKSILTAMSSDDLVSPITITEQAHYAMSLLNESILHELEERNERVSTNLVNSLDSLKNVSRQEIDENVSAIFDTLSEAIGARIEADHLENATIQAIAIAENLDKIFNDYKASFSGSTNITGTVPASNSTGSNIVLNDNAYQRAIALTDIIIKKFDSELRGKAVDSSSMQQALNGLKQLKTSIESKVSPTELLGIMHGHIHPNLQKAFGLKLADLTNSTSNSTTAHLS